MPFKPGQSGNPNGRPKGTPNQTTAEMRERIQRLIDTLEEDVLNDLAALTPSEKAKTYIALLEYVTPKLNRTELEQASTEIKLPQFSWSDGTTQD